MKEEIVLRLKIWTNAETGKRYVASSAFLNPMTGLMTFHAMRDDETLEVAISPDGWNSLPYFFFEELGPAPRPSKTWGASTIIQVVDRGPAS